MRGGLAASLASGRDVVGILWISFVYYYTGLGRFWRGELGGTTDGDAGDTRVWNGAENESDGTGFVSQKNELE